MAQTEVSEVAYGTDRSKRRRTQVSGDLTILPGAFKGFGHLSASILLGRSHRYTDTPTHRNTNANTYRHTQTHSD